MANDLVKNFLQASGPSRSSLVAEHLKSTLSMTPATARQQISRSGKHVKRLNGILPKKEAFLYLEDEAWSDRFVDRLIGALRETGSSYGYALDGLSARRGTVLVDEFAVISGSADRQKGRIPNDAIISRLVSYGLLIKHDTENGQAVSLLHPGRDASASSYLNARLRSEAVILEAFATWLRNLGMVSYGKVAIRGDDHSRMIGPYKFDLTAPCYLAPMTTQLGSQRQPGFIVADVFSDGRLNEHQVAYFLRKVKALAAFQNIGKVMSYLIAPGFSNEALRIGREYGVIMATPANLFGERLGKGLADLTQTLKNAGAVVANEPERLASMVERLSDIEGRSLNLRGILFELLTAFLVRQNGSWVQLGKIATDPDTGKSAEIDILSEQGRTELLAIECKGKAPSGSLSLEEVDEWIRRIPIWTKWLKLDPSRQGTSMNFEIWTSGTIDEDALHRLQKEKQQRTKISINWKDGQAVRNLARTQKEKHVTEAFDEHFFRHPLKDFVDR